MSQIEYSVVVVEDEKLIAKNIAKNIEKANPLFKVVEIFSNGEDAANYIAKKPPHVVFMDIQMPIINGIELLKIISETQEYVYCVILTGYSDFDYAKSAVKYGAIDYLLKPVNPKELSDTLKKIELSLAASMETLSDTLSEHYHKPEEIVDLVKKYIQNHYASTLDLNTIAQELGFSASYLTKLFTKYENTTPSKYIRCYRMNIAKQLLAVPGASINTVAAAVGYTDPFHFSKSFKQTFGVSPTSFKDEGKH
jgi:two-component system, response regulator YesN